MSGVIEKYMEKLKGVFFLVIGLLLLGVAIVTTISTARFVRGSVIAEGRVVRLNAGGSHPEIAFVTRSGAAISYPQGGWIWGYAVGDKVRVRYDEANPKVWPSLDIIGALYAMPIFLSLLGGFFTLFGVIAVLTNGKRSRMFY